MTTQEGDRLIQEFEGLPTTRERVLFSGGTEIVDSIYPYHSDWNWLMPVVEKISQMGHDVNIEVDGLGPWCLIFDTNKAGGNEVSHQGAAPESLIQAIYNSVVMFIQWHNSQSKPTQP
jgi:hypothetical protein